MKQCGLLLLMLLLTSCATKYVVKLGDTPVVIEQIQHGSGKAFVHLHQNETTALRAAKQVVRSQGGSVITLIHSGQRNIVFHLNHQRYEFDPNRIFSDAGIKKTLMTFGHYSPAALLEVKTLANRLKSILPEGKIIAVHNNNDYSIKEYLPGKNLHSDAKALHLDNQRYYRNFYLVTRLGEYQRLKNLHYNAVLQADHATDDGSLSVYLAKRDYVNVEAGYGQLFDQIDMLKWA
jgi:hypothetical protein